MNEWCIYIALFCVLLYTQSALKSCVCGRGSILNHHQCAASTWMMQRRQCSHHTPATGGEESHRANQVYALTTHQLQVERRVIEPIKWTGIIRTPWLTRASGGNLARTPGLHPTLYEKCHGIFYDHRESGPRFNVSSERRFLSCFKKV